MRNALIPNVKRLIRRPYADYAIGITENENKFQKANGTGGIVVVNCRNDAATLEAYTYFTEQGMRALKPIGIRSKYLYLYRLDGEIISII